MPSLIQKAKYTAALSWRHDRILYAVRGRYSAEKLHSEGFEYCDVWGDPALLLPIVYPAKQITKKYTLGIIPHLKDYAFFKQMYGTNKNVHVIDLKTSDIEFVLNQMLACEKNNLNFFTWSHCRPCILYSNHLD